MHEQGSVTVDAGKTSWTLEQIQMVSGLAWALYHIDIDQLHFTLVDDKMTNEETSFEWISDHITQTWLENGDSCLYQVEHQDGFVIVSCSRAFNDENVVLTFKDGLLESIGDAPALRINRNGNDDCKREIWFHTNKCHRLANPELYSMVEYDVYGHHDINGLLHREVIQGPASYWLDENGPASNSVSYYIHGKLVPSPTSDRTDTTEIGKVVDIGTIENNVSVDLLAGTIKDTRIGVIDVNTRCTHCEMVNCLGHYGYITLPK